MGKLIYTGCFPPADLKAEADIPSQANMSTNGAPPDAYIDCTNISLSFVKNVLGGTTYSLFDLGNLDGTFVAGGENGKINVWSRWKPGELSYGGDITDKLPTDVTASPNIIYTKPGTTGLGDFAGYHHSETTKPTYWIGQQLEFGDVIVGTTIPIHNTLAKGRLQPVLSGNPSTGIDESYWDHVKVQSYLKTNSGSYVYKALSDFINWDFGEDGTLLYTIGGNSETLGNSYSACLRPVYIDKDDHVTPIAVIEDGCEIITYNMVSFADYYGELISVTDNGTASEHVTNHNYINYNFYLNNDTPENLTFKIRLRAIADEAEWEEPKVYTGILDHIINASDSHQFTESQVWNLTDVVNDGTCHIVCDISIDGINWSGGYTVATGLNVYANI